MTEEVRPREVTRRNLIADIVGHPDGAPSLEELVHMNPPMSSEDIERHLQSLVDEGTVRVVEADLNDAGVDDPPEKFYELTQAACQRYEETGEYPTDAWQREYSAVEKTERIRILENLPRPN